MVAYVYGVWWMVVFVWVFVTATVLSHLATVYRISSKRTNEIELHSIEQYINLRTQCTHSNASSLCFYCFYCTHCCLLPNGQSTTQPCSHDLCPPSLHPHRSQVLGPGTGKAWEQEGGLFVWFGGLGGLGGDMSSHLPPSRDHCDHGTICMSSVAFHHRNPGRRYRRLCSTTPMASIRGI